MSNSNTVYEEEVAPPRKRAVMSYRILQFLDSHSGGPVDAQLISSRMVRDQFVGSKTITSRLTVLEYCRLVDTHQGVNERGKPTKTYTLSFMGLWVVTSAEGYAALVEMFQEITALEQERKKVLRPIKNRYRDRMRDAAAAVATRYYFKNPLNW